MLHASTRKLIDRLSEMTELGKLDWTNDEDGNISYATEGYSVSLTMDPNEVVITSKDGKELERATVNEIAATEREDGTAYTAIVAAMTTEAARIARGTEAAISSLLAGMADAPADDPVDADPDGAEALQEDVGDETTALAAEPADMAAQDEPTAETVEETASEVASQDDETEMVAADDASSDDADAEETPVEMDAAEAADEASADDDEQTDAAFIVASAEDDVTEAASDDAPFDEVQPDDLAATAETESEPDAPEDADVETESDVSEAVARMANEVKHREDTGLETAAASAVGAVALAAGLTPQDSEPEDASDVEASAFETDAIEEASDTPVETIVTETAEPPAYVPFGLSEAEQDSVVETDIEVEAETEIHVEPELVADADEFVEAAVETSIEPDVEDIASPIEALGQMADDTFATRTETEPVEATPLTLDTEPVETEAPTPFIAETVTEAEPVVEESLAAVADEVVSDAFTPFVATEVSEVEPEPELATLDATPEPEAPAEQSYSLSGIGAGFGLGALSAKTEASGVPGPQSSSVETGEKVIIDATDDVLPKLEGNLNVSLAETASAAVSSANAATESSAPAEAADESDSDILKPRTRFNPWD